MTVVPIHYILVLQTHPSSPRHCSSEASTDSVQVANSLGLHAYKASVLCMHLAQKAMDLRVRCLWTGSSVLVGISLTSFCNTSLCRVLWRSDIILEHVVFESEGVTRILYKHAPYVASPYSPSTATAVQSVSRFCVETPYLPRASNIKELSRSMQWHSVVDLVWIRFALRVYI